MGRSIYINGPALIRVKFGQHVSGFIDGPPIAGIATASASETGASAQLFQLGLSSERIEVGLVFNHQDVHADDYGPSVPADVMWNLAEAHLHMTLVHYDAYVLDQAVAESMCGPKSGGTMMGAGTPLGGMLAPGASGCHYMSVCISSPQAYGNTQVLPWRFRTCYLAHDPLRLPLGTKRSLASLHWRAVPYFGPGFTATTDANAIFSGGFAVQTSGRVFVSDVQSSGRVLWDRVLDT